MREWGWRSSGEADRKPTIREMFRLKNISIKGSTANYVPGLENE